MLDLQTVAPDVTSGEYFRMVQIRNPHGQGEWQGVWVLEEVNEERPEIAQFDATAFFV